jgi:transposase
MCRASPCRTTQGLRYPSDLTDAEWAIAEPMIPPARPGGAVTGATAAQGRTA